MMTLAILVGGWYVQSVKGRAELIQELWHSGCTLALINEQGSVTPNASRNDDLPKWMRHLFGEFAYANVDGVWIDRKAEARNDDLRKLAEFGSLTHVGIESLRIDARGLSHLQNMKHVEELEFWIPITNRELEQIVHIKGVRRLILLDADISDAGLMELTALSDLQELTVIQCQGINLTEDAVVRLTSAMPMLRIDTIAESKRRGHFVLFKEGRLILPEVHSSNCFRELNE